MHTVLEVQNLKCSGCANTIVTKISQINGIENVVVDVEKKSVAFNYDSVEILLETQELLAKIGYPVVG